MGGHILSAAKNAPVGVGNSAWSVARSALKDELAHFVLDETYNMALPSIEFIARGLQSIFEQD